VTYSAENAETGRHEADHAAGLAYRLGDGVVGAVSRRKDGRHCGKTLLVLERLPLGRPPGLSAFDLAVCALLPLVDPACRGGTEDDERVARECAAVAYPYRPEHERGADAEEWCDVWVGRAVAAAVDTVNDLPFTRPRDAIAAALDRKEYLSGDEVREILRAA
jgi:hypothetical protein